jgi:dodecin
MSDSVYVINELVGTSATSWEDAAKKAIETAAGTLKDLRIGEVVKQDLTVENGKVTGFRVRLSISMKYHQEK